ncbi:MAG: hypothetical protein KKF80_06050 [Candidatus Omnitrophica bacterium]|nr:hypothetical protein [Candidatus Omnitrophota bacterium]
MVNTRIRTCMNVFCADNVKKRFAISCIIITALALFLLRVPTILKNPFFVGDSGYRMNFADTIIVILGNRFWLPFLQLHIKFFYQLGLPYWMFKFIPAFYFLLALIFLGIVTYRMLDKSYPSLLFSLFLVFCFAHEQGVKFLNVNLYQEILETALFYILLYLGMLDLKKRWLLLLIASVALLTRECFWVYLFVLSLINWRKIISDKVYIFSFIWLWLIPICWLLVFPLRRSITSGNFPGGFLINQNLHVASGYFTSLSSLGSALLSNKIHFFATGLIVVFVLITLRLKARENKVIQSDVFAARFQVFSLLSLAIIYSFFLLFDPFQCTYGNMRMGIPLLSHMFTWAGILYYKTFSCRNTLKIFSRFILILSISFTVNGQQGELFGKEYPETLKFYQQIKNLKNNVYNDTEPNVCIVAQDYWETLRIFLAPTLYMNRKMVGSKNDYSFDESDIVIAPSHFKFKDSRFLRYAKGNIGKKSYIIYYRKRDNRHSIRKNT